MNANIAGLLASPPGNEGNLSSLLSENESIQSLIKSRRKEIQSIQTILGKNALVHPKQLNRIESDLQNKWQTNIDSFDIF